VTSGFRPPRTAAKRWVEAIHKFRFCRRAVRPPSPGSANIAPFHRISRFESLNCANILSDRVLTRRSTRCVASTRALR
jgi:hypothetical protein